MIISRQISKLLFLFLLPLSQILAQIPDDLLILANSGGSMPGTQNYSLRILANGECTYTIFYPEQIDQAPISKLTVTLDTSQLQNIWDAIQNNDFFNLTSKFKSEAFHDRTFARLLIRANEQIHEVNTENLANEQFDGIVSVINDNTPEEINLIYDTSELLDIIPSEPCEGPGMQQIEPKEYPKKLKSHIESLYDIPETILEDPCSPVHPGSVAAYKLTLGQAAAKGMISLISKGGMFGDCMSITIDNTNPEEQDEIEIRMYLEFWGDGATSENIQKVKNAIESKWSGKTTTDGKKVNVTVKTRNSNSTTTPTGTRGYHQIQLTDTDISYVNAITTPNECYGGGKWDTNGESLDAVYAHEAGHLLGLDDNYSDYRKNPDGSWTRYSDSQNFSSNDLATTLIPQYPSSNQANIKAWLDNHAGGRITFPDTGHENDLMATLNGNTNASHLDDITKDIGLVVLVRSGEVMICRNPDYQNFITIRARDIFVEKNNSKTLNGLFVACIDGSEDTPVSGLVYDVAPALDSWTANDGAEKLEKFALYLDDQQLYCESNFENQMGIWRITDNFSFGNTETLLNNADIYIGNEYMDFPTIENPNTIPESDKTEYIIPHQMFVSEIDTETRLVVPGTTATLKSSLLTPTLPEINISNETVQWTLDLKPQNSSFSISNPNENQINFMPDKSGVYSFKSEFSLDINDNQSTGSLPTTEYSDNVITSTITYMVVYNENTETFESGSLESSDIPWQNNGTYDWTVTNMQSNTGNYSAYLGQLQPGDKAKLDLNINYSQNDYLSFFFKSKGLSMYTLFYIDNIFRAILVSDNDTDNWTLKTFPISQGNHTLSWVVEMDSMAYIDNQSEFFLDDIFISTNSNTTFVKNETDTGHLPETFKLYQNHPNPFNSSTMIQYNIPIKCHVTIKIYNINGQLLETLYSAPRSPGSYIQNWNAQHYATGIYYLVLEAGDYVEQIKMMLIE